MEDATSLAGLPGDHCVILHLGCAVRLKQPSHARRESLAESATGRPPRLLCFQVTALTVRCIGYVRQ
jgi:hypothetical protein